jgi:hypothetical protein
MSGSVVRNGEKHGEKWIGAGEDLKAWKRKWGGVEGVERKGWEDEKGEDSGGMLVKEKLKLEGMLKENEKQGASLTRKPKRQRTTRARAGFESKVEVKAQAKAQIQIESEDAEVEVRWSCDCY